MKPILAAGLMLAIVSGGALAQSAPAPTPAPAATSVPGTTMHPQLPPTGGPIPSEDDAVAPPPPAGPGRHPPPPGGPDAMDDGPGGPPPHPPGGPHGHRPPPPSKAAHFRIDRGDLALDIKCADDEPMKACADLTLQMLDKLQANPKP